MSEKQYMTDGIKIAHGKAGSKNWNLPILATASEKSIRADQQNHLKAHEYLDQDDVLDAKIDLLCNLLRSAKNRILYTGAGLSKSAGIPDYASSSNQSLSAAAIKQLNNPLMARPTKSHRVLSALEKRGFFQYWIQQNHDSLGQKAGFPERKVNSIHGDWYDPSNPVVQFSGSLRGDLFEDLLHWEQATDLCVCLGTSLSGMNADRCAETPARSCSFRMAGEPKSLDELKEAADNDESLGLVIVNLQRTRLDSKCSLRIWAPLDKVWQMVADRMGLEPLEYEPLELPFALSVKGTVFPLPHYDASGARLPEDAEPSDTVLDLSQGKSVRIAHPLASNFNALGTVHNADIEENFQILIERKGKLTRLYTLGRWWIESMIQGELDQLPLVNV